LTNALHEAGIRGGSDGAGRQRTRAVLVITQVALAVILLAGAGLTLKSFWRAQQETLGFDPRHILTMVIALPQARYDKPEKIAAFNAQLIDRVRSLPGVENAAIGANVPFDDTEWDSSFHLTGTPKPPPGKEPSAETNMISPGYFHLLGMPILRGRDFGPEEVAGRPRSVIIDETLAKRYFAGVDPIGQHIDDNQTNDKNPPALTVIGVVPRTRNEAPGEENIEKLHFPQMHFCAAQDPQEENNLLVKVSTGDPLALAGAVKKVIQGLDPDQPVASVHHGSEYWSESGSTAPNHDVTGNLCRACSRPRQRWVIWSDGAHRDAADARIGNSHGPECCAMAGFSSGPRPGHPIGFTWNRFGIGRRFRR